VINQSGGTHVVTNSIYISAYGGYPGQGTYNLSNGTLTASGLYVGAYGTWSQLGGTALVASTFGVGNGASVSLAGGSLRSSRAYLGDMSLEEYPVLTLSGGAHFATNDFTINAGACRLLGGSLLSSNISLLSGTLTNGGCSISNPGVFTLSGGTFYPGARILQLGKLSVGGHARLNFSAGPATVRFAANAGQPWYDFGLLTIEKWAGATNGGGSHQLICGTSSGGISAQQLSKIVFQDPAGLAPGPYLARVLPTGEIVPSQPAAVAYTRQAKQMVMTWPAGFTLQTATNIAGPFMDVPEATSPFTNAFTGDPQRYFRIFHY